MKARVPALIIDGFKFSVEMDVEEDEVGNRWLTPAQVDRLEAVRKRMRRALAGVAVDHVCPTPIQWTVTNGGSTTISYPTTAGWSNDDGSSAAMVPA